MSGHRRLPLECVRAGAQTQNDVCAASFVQEVHAAAGQPAVREGPGGSCADPCGATAPARALPVREINRNEDGTLRCLVSWPLSLLVSVLLSFPGEFEGAPG
ncbi:unnamed protein product [Prorocentrum cordatum]|uniref:Uncharacterized protein n=1 Tax=Prorocentrum cordatum TaxID=2364126 RepID=A0ABN9UPI2_9DINO|nr:unnamed protein product [Polarella glacialis]